MKPPRFDFVAPSTLAEAVDAISSADDPGEAKLMAGGQSLMPLLNLRLAQPRLVIDLNRVEEMVGIDDTADHLVVGAMTRQRSAERSKAVSAGCPLIVEALSLVGHPQIRNRGTVGGSISHADPAAELPAVAVCLDAEMVVAGSGGERTVGAAEFFTGFLSTALAEDEILVAIRFPKPAAGTGWSFTEVSRRSGDFAMVGVAVTLRLDGDTVADARIALSGVGATPLRSSDGEAVLIGGRATDEEFRRAGVAAAATLEPPEDLHGSSHYRRHVAGVVVERALSTAAARARRMA